MKFHQIWEESNLRLISRDFNRLTAAWMQPAFTGLSANMPFLRRWVAPISRNFSLFFWLSISRIKQVGQLTCTTQYWPHWAVIIRLWNNPYSTKQTNTKMWQSWCSRCTAERFLVVQVSKPISRHCRWLSYYGLSICYLVLTSPEIRKAHHRTEITTSTTTKNGSRKF